MGVQVRTYIYAYIYTVLAMSVASSIIVYRVCDGLWFMTSFPAQLEGLKDKAEKDLKLFREMVSAYICTHAVRVWGHCTSVWKPCGNWHKRVYTVYKCTCLVS